MTSLAPSSLVESYTDSEGEENARKEVITIDLSVNLKQDASPKPKGPVRLVSYRSQDDNFTSEDELEDHETTNSTDISSNENQSSSIDADTSIKPIFTDVDFPPEPTGTCSSDLTQKIGEMTKMMEVNGCDINFLIQQRKSFRNPSIYEKLIDYCNINEFGTNYEPQIYDPLKWDKSSYYDELGKAQNLHMKKLKKVKTKVAVLYGTAKNNKNGTTVAERHAIKRNSKWDNVVHTQTGYGLQNNVTTQYNSTSDCAGTKHIISATGSSRKKNKS